MSAHLPGWVLWIGVVGGLMGALAQLLEWTHARRRHYETPVLHLIACGTWLILVGVLLHLVVRP
jgi:H+/Cl- antiporter ClcA